MSSLLSQSMVVNLYSYTLFCGLCDITLSTFIQFFLPSFINSRKMLVVFCVRGKTKLSLSQITSNIFSFLFLLIQILWRYYYYFHTYAKEYFLSFSSIVSYERRNKTKGVYKDEFDMYHENLNLIHLRRVILREIERE